MIALGFDLDHIIGNESLSSKSRSELRQVRVTLSSIIDQLRNEIYQLRELDIRLGKDLENFLQSNLSTSIDFESDSLAVIYQRFGVQISEFGYLLLELIRNCQKHQLADHFQISHSLTGITLRFERRSLKREQQIPGFGIGLAGVSERLEALNCSISYYEDSLEIHWN